MARSALYPACQVRSDFLKVATGRCTSRTGTSLREAFMLSISRHCSSGLQSEVHRLAKPVPSDSQAWASLSRRSTFEGGTVAIDVPKRTDVLGASESGRASK